MVNMPPNDAPELSNNRFAQTLDAAARLPGVRIHRSSYLRAALKPYCDPDVVDEAIRTTPADAGVPEAVIAKLARAAINYETAKVTSISTVAGIPGGFAMLGTVPADLAQYMGHMLRIAQKLAYLYSWPELFEEAEELDDSTQSVLVLFIGVMFGVQIAQGGVTKVAGLIAANVAKKLPQKALTQGMIFPVVRKVAAYLGIRMTKRAFAGGVAKAIPIIGAVVSGGLTLGTFLPMSKRLQKHLSGLELAQTINTPGETGKEAATGSTTDA